ncbi:MAG: Outer membrane porin protein 32 precursor [Burkholderiaceae bacterium]|nr:MAG: Outer membrane porin protein 32 precursor [Burkholderiaceae bacterium]
MKKSLVALAAIAFVGAASAQTSGSSVTLWGVVDAGISHYSMGPNSKTMFDQSGLASSQLGFRGTEDLGGGMSANFWLEMAVLNGTGGAGGTVTSQNGAPVSSLFSRRSTVSLAGNFGEVRLGRDYTPTFWSDTVFDPFGTLGPGAGSNITAGGQSGISYARASNSIQYLWGFAPNGNSAVGSGIYAQLMYAFPGNTNGTPSIGQYAGARIGYANGPINVAADYGQTTTAPVAGETADNSKLKSWDIAGSYNFGVATAMAHYGVNDADSNVNGNKYTHWGLGATINAGPGYIPISYNRIKQDNATNDGADQWALGYVYNLSKRTALYGTVSHISNKNNGAYGFSGGNGGGNPGLPAVAGASGTGYGVGLKTSF